MIVKVKWNAEAVRSIEEQITRVKLKKKDSNPEEHGDRVWREDLIHLTKSAEDYQNIRFPCSIDYLLVRYCSHILI